MPSKYKWLLDFGHGGMQNGHYVTTPNKMYTFTDGYVAYEGVINRGIGYKLAGLLKTTGIDHRVVSDEVEDISLFSRVYIADAEYMKDGRCVFLSIHSNSASNQTSGPGNGASGFECFVYPLSSAYQMAETLAKTYIEHFPNKTWRVPAPGVLVKQAKYYVLRKTDCPAILVENLFFDNRAEAEYLNSHEGQEAIARCLFDFIMKCETDLSDMDVGDKN